MEIITIRSVLALLVLCCACSLLPAIKANEFEYCTSTEYPVRVHDVEISPQPDVNGEPTTFTMTVIAGNSSITGGEWKIEISNTSGIVISNTYPLCEQTTCPIDPGKEFTLSITETYKRLEPGTYTLTMTIISEDNEDLVCIHSNFEVVDPAYSYIRKVSGI